MGSPGAAYRAGVGAAPRDPRAIVRNRRTARFPDLAKLNAAGGLGEQRPVTGRVQDYRRPNGKQGERGTQDSNLESPVLETGALAS